MLAFLLERRHLKGIGLFCRGCLFFAAAMCSGFAEQGRGEIEIQEASVDAFRFDLLAIDSGDFTFVIVSP
jgi:hypothetical protein